jgi:Cu+-exporting ATPase
MRKPENTSANCSIVLWSGPTESHLKQNETRSGRKHESAEKAARSRSRISSLRNLRYEATALSAERDGEKFYFCSEHCRQKFLGQIRPMPPVSAKSEHGGHSHDKDDEHHVHSHHGHEHATVKPPAAAKYFCPMHPEVIADKPGSCPKCGMALERNPVWKPDQKVIYTCPLHPEVEQDHPGTCPKCGMALELKTVSADTEEDDSELRDMTRRFWIGTALAVPVFVVATAHVIPAWSHAKWVTGEVSR